MKRIRSRDELFCSFASKYQNTAAEYMLSKEELEDLNSDVESDRVERTISVTNMDKFSEAVCAFSNDFPNHKLPGFSKPISAYTLQGQSLDKKWAKQGYGE
jgi:hypothetical protein